MLCKMYKFSAVDSALSSGVGLDDRLKVPSNLSDSLISDPALRDQTSVWIKFLFQLSKSQF